MAEVRQRKANASSDTTANEPPPATPAAAATSDDSKKKKKARSDSDPPPPAAGYDVGILNIALAVGSILTLTAVAIGVAIHFLDPFQHLEELSASVAASNAKPASSSSDTTTDNNNNLRTFTPSTLSAYTGADPDTPIYISINGTVYDVSASPTFYGPSGPYGHFAGRDATRAWVTECFGSTGLTAAELADEAFVSSQLTHTLAGVADAMFRPLWLDEALQDAADGRPVNDDAAALFPAASIPAGTTLPDKLRKQAQAALARFGRVDDDERERRREADAVEAEQAVERALAKWVGFFASSGKYQVVGRMVFDDEAGDDGLEEDVEPPAICEKARKKRPIKGGKLEAVMGMMQKLMGGDAGANAPAGAGAGASQGKGQMPEFVKQMLEKREKEKKAKN
ncbi:putative heme steroid binding domain protein [Lasiodiplodia theobromae]|uniref:Heme steroid binding domain protein n=1 Tax=Lasiodiplodia theobromae TaxID=45133 RepID=A0A8H7M6W0_9PEZI|nr:putative heme steroid binding domain protein [Lasiodiplodia theobromae]